MSRKYFAVSVLLLTSLVSACANHDVQILYAPSKVPSMSLKQATGMIDGFKNGVYWPPGAGAFKLPTRFQYVHIDSDKFVFVTKGHKYDQTFPFKGLTVQAGFAAGSGECLNVLLNGYAFSTCQEKDDQNYFHRLANAFVVVREETPDATQEAAFEKAADAYRKATVKPVPGEDVRRYDVMAEDAINRKHFDEAMDDYRSALKVAPWWPQGQFNLGMILGELHYYDAAINHMKKYLALVPDASNARAARDQIYRWESEAESASSGQ